MASLSRLVLYFVLLGAAALPFSMEGQTGRLMAHFDKDFYVSGEVIWYTVYLPEFFKDFDRVLRVSIVDDQGNVDAQYHLRTDGETSVDGYYKVPYEAQTGVYRVFVHSLSRYIGQDVKLLEARVPIYNDFDVVKADLTSSNDATGRVKNQLGIDISLDDDAVVNGQTELNIAVTDGSGQPVEANISVSVADAQLCGRGIIAEGELVELRGVQSMHNSMIMKGTIFDKTGTPVQVNVLGAYSPDVQRVVYSKSDDNGKFHVDVPDFNGVRSVQFLGYSVEIVDFDVEVPEEFVPEPIDDKVVYTEEVIQYLELSRKRKKIYQYFTTIEHSLEPEPVMKDVQKLKPDYRFDMDEYESFDNIHAFFDELITALKFQEEDSVFRARLENPKGRNVEQTNLRGNPLFIVDGVATRNADFVARIDFGVVKYVDLYYDPIKLRKYFNAVGRSGVVIITTKLQEFDFPQEEFADIFTIPGLQPKADFPVSTSAVEGMPNIKPQVYWQGATETDYDGTTTISFPQSADRSRFRIHVVAQSISGERSEAILEYDLINQ